MSHPLPDPPARLTINIDPNQRRRLRRAATAEHRTESAQLLWYVEVGLRQFESVNVDRAQVAALGEK